MSTSEQHPTPKQLLDEGKTDEEVVAYIMEQSGVVEQDAWQILAWEKGEDASDIRG